MGWAVFWILYGSFQALKKTIRGVSYPEKRPNLMVWNLGAITLFGAPDRNIFSGVGGLNLL